MTAAPVPSAERIAALADPGSWRPWGLPTGAAPEAVVVGQATVAGWPVAVLAGEFSVQGGSLGVAATDRLVAGVHRATREGRALVALTASGGTRMQDGTPAFVGLIPLTAALGAHRRRGLAYVVHLGHPTTGGVMASWGSLGQLTLAEPGALLGFLGPRAQAAVQGAPLPDGVQRADHLAGLGLVDDLVPWTELGPRVARWLDVAVGAPDPVAPAPAAPPARSAPVPLASPGARVSSPAPALPGAAGDSAALSAVVAVERTRRYDRPGPAEILAAQASAVTRFGGRGHGVLAALARLGGEPCVVVGHDRDERGRGVVRPAGLGLVRRAHALAAELRLPVVTLIDSAGAEVSVAAEEEGLSAELAATLAVAVDRPAPTVAVLLGQGAGAAALALLPADRVLAAADAWLSPLPPEGVAAILRRDPTALPGLLEDQRVTAADLAAAGVVHRLVTESGTSVAELPARVATAVAAELAALRVAPPADPGPGGDSVGAVSPPELTDRVGSSGAAVARQ